MSLDTETLSTLNGADRVRTLAKHLKSIPLAQRAGVMETVQRGLKEREAARLTYNWSLHARDSQLPPPGDWDTWMILADESGKLSPNAWALRAAHLFDKFNATRIVVEDNAGGQMAESTIQNAVERTLPVKTVRARRGKYIRAEPVASLYEQSLPRTPIRGPRPPRRSLPRPRRPDVYLERRPRPVPITRPRRRPGPRRHSAHPKPQPHHDLVNPKPYPLSLRRQGK